MLILNSILSCKKQENTLQKYQKNITTFDKSNI